jgi:dynactin complex subunit
MCEITARYGGLLKGSEKALVRVYIMPILQAHREEIAKVTNFELTDEFLNCPIQLYKVLCPSAFWLFNFLIEKYFRWKSIFKEVEQLCGA